MLDVKLVASESRPLVIGVPGSRPPFESAPDSTFSGLLAAVRTKPWALSAQKPGIAHCQAKHQRARTLSMRKPGQSKRTAHADAGQSLRASEQVHFEARAYSKQTVSWHTSMPGPGASTSARMSGRQLGRWRPRRCVVADKRQRKKRVSRCFLSESLLHTGEKLQVTPAFYRGF